MPRSAVDIGFVTSLYSQISNVRCACIRHFMTHNSFHSLWTRNEYIKPRIINYANTCKKIYILSNRERNLIVKCKRRIPVSINALDCTCSLNSVFYCSRACSYIAPCKWSGRISGIQLINTTLAASERSIDSPSLSRRVIAAIAISIIVVAVVPASSSIFVCR